MNEVEQKVSLACTQGGSDKVYFAQLTASGGGWLVTAQYGPRGGTLKSADKHATPFPYASALKTFNSLVKSKMAKGYVPSETAGETRLIATPTVATFTDIRVQLLNEIQRCEVRMYLGDPAFVAEIKHDGERRPLVIDGGEIYGLNKKGQRVPLPIAIARQAEALPVGREGRTVLDGELVGDTLHVWDLLEREGHNQRDLSLRERARRLRGLFEGFPGASPIVVTETADGFEAKSALLERVIAEGLEGIVLKRASAPYTPDRPASGGDWLKYKLKATATVRVKARNIGKASIAVEVKDGDDWCFIGNVTVPPNQSMPDAGRCVEVEYLYIANRGGCLFQPVYKGVRTDQDEGDCGIGQLKYKGLAQVA